MGVDVSAEGLRELFKEKIAELQNEPEFMWGTDRARHAVDAKGEPSVKVAVGNVPLDYDLWEGLRNPAVVGLYPVGLCEIWEFYANRRKEKVDEFGRQTIFQTPRTFAFAQKNFNRAVIASVMLPFSPRIVKDYVRTFAEEARGSSHLFARMFEDANNMIDKAVSRVAIELVSNDTVVVAISNDNVKNISTEAVPPTHQGASHGPSKGGNYPQKSVAALMGLGQFGVSRIVFRDELIDGKVQRYVGPIRSIVIFDKHDLVKDGEGDIILPTKEWRKFLFELFDFTNTNPEINKFRFCTYIPQGDEGCRNCIGCCPSGAQANSVPTQRGVYSESVAKQGHRFWEGKLQFDFGKCCDVRGQMGTLFPEWSCARCVTICAAEGNRRESAASSFYEKMCELTRE